MAPSKKGSDPSRAERKAKKRKLEDAIPDLPGDDELEQVNTVSLTKSKVSKKRKREDGDAATKEDQTIEGGIKRSSNKGKKSETIEEDVAPTSEENNAEKAMKKVKRSKDEANDEATIKGSSNDPEVDDAPKKSKKERKAERKAREAVESGARGGEMPSKDAASKEADGADTATTPVNSEEKKPKKNNRNREKKRKAALENGGEGKAPRFIAFIGNLPYSATTGSLQKHFASVKPKSVRHPTEKDNPQISKGFAFIEFEGYDHMKTCLKLFHHSMFDDGVSPPRKINVELTAGGGGNTKDRRAKIESKNQKLNDERVRRLQEEDKAKGTKKEVSIDENAIHPSRRARVPGA